MNILIVDDDIFVKKVLGFQLTQAGHSVTIAGNGDEAIHEIETIKNFDLIFCDILMPVISGPSFLLLLKKYYPKGIPAIAIISGLKNAEEFLIKLDINYDYFLVKPIDAQKIDVVLNEVMEKNKSRTSE